MCACDYARLCGLYLRALAQAVAFPSSSHFQLSRPLQLEHDKEWLAITRAFAMHEPLLFGEPKFNTPQAKSPSEYAALIDESLAWIDSANIDLRIAHDFQQTAPVYDGQDFRAPQYQRDAGGLKEYTNPQTARFCKLLEIPNPFDISEDERVARMQAGPGPDENERSGRGVRGRGGFGGGRGRGRGGGRGGFRGRGGSRGR